MNQFIPDYYITPTIVSNHANTEPFDEKVYAIVYWFEHMKDGKCTASNETIAAVAKPHDPQPRSVQNSLNRLEECGFIRRIYKDKSKRHRLSTHTLVRFKLERNGDDTSPQSEMAMALERNGDDSQSEMAMTILRKSNKEKELRRERDPSASIGYLSSIPYDDMKMFMSRISATEDEIKNKAEDLLLWCESNGKSKKNYRAFLLNALKKDFKKRDPSKEDKYKN